MRLNFLSVFFLGMGTGMAELVAWVQGADGAVAAAAEAEAEAEGSVAKAGCVANSALPPPSAA